MHSVSGIRKIAGRAFLLLGTSLAAVPVAAAAAAPSSQALPPAGPANAGVEEIVVTAQKRSQNLQKVPISITALTANTLVANRVYDVRDLNAVATNLTVRTGAAGVSAPNYTMRGIVALGAAPGSDKGVSLYLDGVYLQNSTGSVFELADVDRIEILKGPQGTLFGRNATGGAISIITRNPTGVFGVHQELTYGNYDQFRSKTRVDLPAVGPLSASITYLHSQRRGDTRNLGAGTQWDYGPATDGKFGVRTSPKYLGDENIEAVSAAVKLDVMDGLDIVYKFDYSQNHYTPSASGVDVIYPAALGAPGAGLLSAILATQPDPSILTPVSKTRPNAVNNWFTTPAYTRTMGHNLTARYAISDQISIKNILAFRSVRNNATDQLDGLGGLVNTLPVPFFGPVGTPFLVTATDAQLYERQWSNETQLNIDTRWFTITAGYIHFHDHYDGGSFPGAPNVLAFNGVPNYVIPTNGSQSTVVNVNSDAWFVQPEFHLARQLDLVLGSRITKDLKTGVDRTGYTTASPLAIPIFYEHSKPTFLAGLNYRPLNNVLTYAKFTTGYISGGFFATRSFAPETSKSYEVGVKADLLDQHLRTNLSAFDVKYNNLQFTNSGASVGLPAFSQVVINAGNAKAKGFEFESTAVPTKGLTLSFNVGYTDFKFTSVSPLLAFFGNYIPALRPKWTGNASIQYETPEVFDGAHLLMRVDTNYRSKQYLVATYPSQAILDRETVYSSWIVNGRVGLVDLDIARKKAQVALWGRNILNNKKIDNASIGTFVTAVTYERARTFGLDLSFDL